ncbi:MAG: D-alanyl-D-alanine carboxypeptidase [Solirubrobacterales bacterium]|nr:D-alanyl-D-alanine carboxypeptidase [Solirubrobacterales bacterium]
MRLVVPLLGLLVTLALALTAAPGAGRARSPSGGGAAMPGDPAPHSRAESSLVGSLNQGMRQAGVYSGAEVVDLDTGQTLFSHNADTPRLPASIEKLFTTTTALTRFGAGAHLSTTVLGAGQVRGSTYHGSLYLRGGGDPTFGSPGFDDAAYGTGATMPHLVANLISSTGIRALSGSIVADETLFDADRGTPATGDQPSIDVEGELSALAYDRGWSDADGTAYFAHPALQAGEQFAAALRAAGVRLPRHLRITAGATPSSAHQLAFAGSPRIATLVALTNTPSDNFFAEMLLKGLGARYGTGGTTADGAAVVRAQVARSFDIHPRLNDGSGLSRYDRTTPDQVVALLGDEWADPAFTASLAVAGETGTLVDEMQGTIAQGRCRAKTGTLHDVSNVAGYCRARDGHTLAYAFLLNGIDPDYAHPITDAMQETVAGYTG